MVTYNSNKINRIYENFTKILEKNNIDVYDSESFIPQEIKEILINNISCTLESANKFVSVPCPKCGKSHLNPIQSTYQRNIVFKIKNLLIKLKINVKRVKCSNCGSTHALLPSFCVPFKQYSKETILDIASKADEESTQKVADDLNIDSKQVRRFVNIVKKFKNKILYIFKKHNDIFERKININSHLYDIINSLTKKFDEIYFKEFRKKFLYIQYKRILFMQYKIIM